LDERLNDGYFMVNHRFGEAWIGAEEQGLLHQLIGPWQFWNNQAKRLWTFLPKLHESRLSQQVSAKKHAAANPFGGQMAAQIRTRKWRI
jgi:hypothetical protein